jgi:hypothetical protein
MWLQENKHKRSGKLTFYDSCHVTSRNGCHLRCHACKPSHLWCHACTPCHQSKRGKPRRIRAFLMDFTWIHGPTRVPKPPQEHMYTEADLRDHRTTPKKHTPSGAHLGSADPRISWIDHGSVDPRLPHGVCPSDLEASTGCFTSSCAGALAYKWKGRGIISYQHILLLLSHFWFIRLRGRLE